TGDYATVSELPGALRRNRAREGAIRPKSVTFDASHLRSALFSPPFDRPRRYVFARPASPRVSPMQSSLQRPVLAEPPAALPAVHAVPPPRPPPGAEAAAALLARVDERTLCERALGGDTEAWNALVHK